MTLAGPFEWDVKRLATSFEIAGRHRNFSDADRTSMVAGVVRTYREAMRQFAAMEGLEVTSVLIRQLRARRLPVQPAGART